MLRFRGAVVGIGVLLAAYGSAPVAGENVLRWARGTGGAVTCDPHVLLDSPTKMSLHQVYENLVTGASGTTWSRSWR